MDEALTRVAIDLSGRPYLSWDVAMPAQKLGDIDTELFKEWFRAFSQAAGATLHVDRLQGENTHHNVDSCHKGRELARREAVANDTRNADALQSTHVARRPYRARRTPQPRYAYERRPTGRHIATPAKK